MDEQVGVGVDSDGTVRVWIYTPITPDEPKEIKEDRVENR